MSCTDLHQVHLGIKSSGGLGMTCQGVGRWFRSRWESFGQMRSKKTRRLLSSVIVHLPAERKTTKREPFPAPRTSIKEPLRRQKPRRNWRLLDM